MKNKILLLLLIAIALSAGCNKSVELQTKLFEVESLHISPEYARIPLNSQCQFYAVAVAKDGSSQRVNAVWDISNSILGTMDANGLFYSSSVAGGGSIRATYGAFYDFVSITVTPGSLASIQVSPSSIELGSGDTYLFELIAKDSYGNEVYVTPTWSVEGGIGQITSDYGNRAYFLATTAGTGHVKATCGAFEGSANVEVINIIPYTYVLQWSTQVGTQSATPKGVAVGPDNNIWVTMYIYSGGSNVGSVFKCDPSGTFILSLEATVTGEGTLKVPNDLAFDSGGNIYVVDLDADKIRKYDSGGNFVLAWGGTGSNPGKFNDPARIAVDKNDYIYVTDKYNDRVQKFDSSGNFILGWGSWGDMPGEFEYPTGIAIDSNNYVYVADQSNYRIQKFDRYGNYLSSWGKEGSAVGQFGQMVGITIDNEDKLFITDVTNDRILKHDNQGGFITRWGGYGDNNGKFNDPMDVAADSAGNIYVVDVNNKRIQKFKP